MSEARRLLKMFEADFDAKDMELLRKRMEDQMVRPRVGREREAEREMALEAPKEKFRVGDVVKLLPGIAGGKFAAIEDEPLTVASIDRFSGRPTYQLVNQEGRPVGGFGEKLIDFYRR